MGSIAPGTLIVNHSVVSENVTSGVDRIYGGGNWEQRLRGGLRGPTPQSRATRPRSRSTFTGGGDHSEHGALTLTNSTIAGNSAAGATSFPVAEFTMPWHVDAHQLDHLGQSGRGRK